MRTLHLLLAAGCLPALAGAQSLFTGVPTPSPSAGSGTSAPSAAAGSPTAPTAGGGAVVDGPCNDVCSDSFGSLDAIQSAVDSIAAGSSGTICLCATTFEPDAKNCGSAGGATPAVLVGDGQDVTIECASPLGAECHFACPEPLFQVAAGGKLTVEGHNNTRISGGATYSRVHVDEGAAFTIVGVVFENNDAGPEARRREAEEITAIGWGAGIYSNGTLEVDQCAFTDCTAAYHGGGIYTGGEASVTYTSFTGCQAVTGGGIYADGALHIVGNIFEENVATDGPGANLAGTAALTGCGNTGLEKSTACPVESGAAATGGGMALATAAALLAVSLVAA